MRQMPPWSTRLYSTTHASPNATSAGSFTAWSGTRNSGLRNPVHAIAGGGAFGAPDVARVVAEVAWGRLPPLLHATHKATTTALIASRLTAGILAAGNIEAGDVNDSVRLDLSGRLERYLRTMSRQDSPGRADD